MWTIEYKVSERDRELTPTGIRADTPHAAWVAFGLQVRADGITYEVAHAFGPPASLASIAKVDRVWWPDA